MIKTIYMAPIIYRDIKKGFFNIQSHRSEIEIQNSYSSDIVLFSEFFF